MPQSPPSAGFFFQNAIINDTSSATRAALAGSICTPKSVTKVTSDFFTPLTVNRRPIFAKQAICDRLAVVLTVIGVKA
jgi:hypothetical protein